MDKIIISKFLALSLLVISSVASFAATSNKVVTLTFNEDMFEINVENGVVQDVIDKQNSAALPNDSTMPSLPIMAFTVAADPHVDCTFSPKIVSKKLILENVDIITAPPAYPTSMFGKVTLGKRGNYSGDVYPSEICTLTGKSEWSDATHLHFLCSPFIYDGKARRLYLIEQLDVDITTTDALSKQKLASENFDFMTPSPEFMQNDFGVIEPSFPLPMDTSAFSRDDDGNVLLLQHEYLIITSEKLAPSFEPLLKWKKAKGLQAYMVTVESICKQHKYSGVDTPAKIKAYLRKNAKLMGIKYVLLGGDDTVVPVRYCAGNATIETDRLIPADLYYACINDPYDWDKNGNGIYGEPDDDISMAHSFAVTRVPVSTTWFAKAYVDKVLQYETEPRWHNSFFMGGYNMNELEEDGYDVFASTLGHAFYNKYVQPERDFKRIELFNDTNTLGYDTKEALTLSNLRTQFDVGYNFVSFITHGSQVGWCIGPPIIENGKKGRPTYFTAHAAGQQNHSGHTLITTMACQTNAFDITDSLISEASLSEMFIRNANSGVIGYLGSSRAGYYTPSNYSIGTSQQYEGEFYKYLFNPKTSNSYGVAVAEAKANMIPYCSSINKAYRYVMFGLNPLGDPEMPIFTQTPLYFNGTHTSINDRTLEISNIEEGSLICIREFGSSSGYYKLYKNRNSVTATKIPDIFTVCITKQDYVPEIYAFNRKPDGTYVKTMLYSSLLAQDNFGQKPITGQILNWEKVESTSGTAFDVTTLVSESASSALIQVTQSSGSITNKVSIPTGENTTIVPIQSNTTGTIIISLIVDGVVQESIFIRK